MSGNLKTVYVDWIKLNAGLIANEPKKELYLLIVLNTGRKLVWMDRMPNIQPLTIMFSAIRSFQAYSDIHQMSIQHVVTYLKKEFYVRRHKSRHPFERLLNEMDISHGIRRSQSTFLTKFQKVLSVSLQDEGPFQNVDDFDAHLVDFMTYYNHPEVVNVFSSDSKWSDFDFYETSIGEHLTKMLISYENKMKQKEVTSRRKRRSKNNPENNGDLAVYDDDFNPVTDWKEETKVQYETYEDFNEKYDFEVTKKRQFLRFQPKRSVKEYMKNERTNKDDYEFF